MYEGLQLARTLKFDKVEVRIDSAEVVHHIQGKQNAQQYGNNLLSSIRNLCELEWEVIIKHIHREANQLEDAMAIFSYFLKDNYNIFVVCPSEVEDLYRADINRIGSSRAVIL